jgi:predicted transcriptional regulator
VNRELEPDLDISVFRPDRPGIRKVLGDLEAEIMEFIWARPPDGGTTVREVFEALYERRRIAYTTVMNTMARLARKRLLLVEKDDQAYVYRPVFSQDEFVSRFVERVLESLLVSFTGPTLESLNALADPATAERARQLLDEIRRRRAAEEAP